MINSYLLLKNQFVLTTLKYHICTFINEGFITLIYKYKNYFIKILLFPIFIVFVIPFIVIGKSIIGIKNIFVVNAPDIHFKSE